jgi:ferredoxin
MTRVEVRMALEVSVDPDLCIGSGDCVRTLPTAFVLDDALGVSVPTSNAADADPDLLVRAARSCPTQAIVVARDGIIQNGPTGGPGAAFEAVP